jgi:ectoine hydroxylase-related dioxygenase (phytanoyl-CoA dioxygenase family)
MPSPFTPADLDFYRANGYILNHRQVFSPEKFARLNALFEEQLALKGDMLSDELDTPHFRDKRLLEFLLADEVLDLVEPFIGPNIGLFSSHFISKDPYKGRATPWHEDSAFWKPRFNRFDKIITLWLAIDRSTRENGCMRVIPGTQANGFSEYSAMDSGMNTFNAGIAPEKIDESQAVYFELERGECSLHDSRIIHGALANTSPHRRCGYTMRYFATDHQVNLASDTDGFKIWLARGKDLAGNHFVNS